MTKPITDECVFRAMSYWNEAKEPTIVGLLHQLLPEIGSPPLKEISNRIELSEENVSRIVHVASGASSFNNAAYIAINEINKMLDEQEGL